MGSRTVKALNTPLRFLYQKKKEMRFGNQFRPSEVFWLVLEGFLLCCCCCVVVVVNVVVVLLLMEKKILSNAMDRPKPEI